MKTLYFLNENGGARVRPTSVGNKIMWTNWYLKHGMREVSREEYEAAKKCFGDTEYETTEVLNAAEE